MVKTLHPYIVKAEDILSGEPIIIGTRTSVRAIELKPDYASAYLRRALALRDVSRFSDSISDYKKALEIRGEDSNTLANLGQVLFLVGEDKEAERVLESLFTDSKPLSPGWNLRPNIEKALNENHPNPEKLNLYAKKISGLDYNVRSYF